MKRFVWVIVATFLFSGLSANAEEEAPDQIIRESAEAAQAQEVVAVPSPRERWQAFIEAQGWPLAETDDGVIHVDEKIIASALVSVNVRLGQPGWVESRIAAFERAELEAKGKIIRSLVDTTETRRSLAVLENAVWQDGDIHKVQQLNEVAETMERIARKTMDLTESSLDAALHKLDPDYDPEQYKNKSQEELQQIAENSFMRQVQSIAMKTVIGAIPVYSTEGKMGNDEYQVLVGVIWSPKLNRLAMSLMNDEYNIPPVAPGKVISEYLPTDDEILLGTLGTKVVIDEKGHYAVMSYGQAQPRRAAVGRELAALHDANQIAANRARAAIVNFIQEGLTLRQSELSEELSREFSDMTFGTEVVREYRNVIAGKKVKVQLMGLRVVKEWNAKHPETGQPVAGTVVAWTPSAAEISKAAAAAMAAKPSAEAAAEAKQPDGTAGSSLESIQVDTSKY